MASPLLEQIKSSCYAEYEAFGPSLIYNTGLGTLIDLAWHGFPSCALVLDEPARPFDRESSSLSIRPDFRTCKLRPRLFEIQKKRKDFKT